MLAVILICRHLSLQTVPVPDPTVVSSKSYTTQEDTPLVVDAPNGLLVGASDPDGLLIEVTNVTASANGTLTVARNGSFIYVPSPNFNGQDSFAFVAGDGFGPSGKGFVNLTIGACCRQGCKAGY